MSEPVRFEYRVDPTSVRSSASPTQPSVVQITLLATNRSGQYVTCPQIYFVLPTGRNQYDQATLTIDPSTIKVAPGPRTPWELFPGGDGTWYAVPVPPATGLEAGATLSVICSNIVVNQAPGQAILSIEQLTADGPDQRTLRATATLTKTADR